MQLRKLLLLAILATFLFNSCKKDAPFVPLFSLNDDITLGKQVKAEIAADPTQFPIASRSQYASAYAFLDGIRNELLNSSAIVYKDEFEWELFIIDNDTTLNAFCTPGGYIYVYTGLMKYLDSKDELAGVIGHEMAHADRRHTSRSLQTRYGISTLLSVVLGKDDNALKDIAGGLYLLRNSRDHEKEADEYSVKYLCPTSYNAAGAAGFFSKLIADGYDCESSAFFSTHPNSCDRVQKIQSEKTTLNCSGNQTFSSEYATFKSTLP